jgi:hypothetical protein
MSFSKVLVARNSPQNKCFAEDGEWLMIGREGQKMKGGLPQDHHFFVGLSSGQPSRYGWVFQLEHEISPEELAAKITSPPSEELVGSCLTILKAAAKYEVGTPMACTYSTIGVMTKQRVLRVHKVLFYQSE